MPLARDRADPYLTARPAGEFLQRLRRHPGPARGSRCPERLAWPRGSLAWSDESRVPAAWEAGLLHRTQLYRGTATCLGGPAPARGERETAQGVSADCAGRAGVGGAGEVKLRQRRTNEQAQMEPPSPARPGRCVSCRCAGPGVAGAGRDDTGETERLRSGALAIREADRGGGGWGAGNNQGEV